MWMWKNLRLLLLLDLSRNTKHHLSRLIIVPSLAWSSQIISPLGFCWTVFLFRCINLPLYSPFRGVSWKPNSGEYLTAIQGVVGSSPIRSTNRNGLKHYPSRFFLLVRAAIKLNVEVYQVYIGDSDSPRTASWTDHHSVILLTDKRQSWGLKVLTHFQGTKKCVET